jgi:hypothetical protein
MSAARANTLTLAWLLTAVSCLLVGMAITEVRNHVSAPSVLEPAGFAMTDETADPPT